MTLTLRGELPPRGAEALLPCQGRVNGITVGWLCTGQPIRVGEKWSQETIHLAPDPKLWTAMGSRHDRTGTYGTGPLERVLGDVNGNILLVLFPLDVAPMRPIDGDRHVLRPQNDYPVWRSRLPDGYVSFDEIRIEFS
jgi:hypothetical protein